MFLRAFRCGSVILALGLPVWLWSPGSGHPPAPAKVRVGVYSSRAVALAYGRSPAFQREVKSWHEKGKELEKAGQKTELEALGQKARRQQERLHWQVFSDAPIPGILARLGAVLEEQARRERLDLIVRETDIAYRGPGVELHDITPALVEPFHPSEKTREMIEDIKDHPPVPLETLVHSSHEH